MKNVISVTSVKKDVDTSMIARHMAEEIARNYPEKKVIFVSTKTDPHLSYDLAGLLFSDNTPVIANEGITNLFALYVKKTDGLGSMEPIAAECIVKEFAKTYDAVICDAGRKFESGYSLGCMFASEKVYFVFDHTKESIRRYSWMEPLIWKLDIPVAGFILDLTSGGTEYTQEELITAADRSSLQTFMIDKESGYEAVSHLSKLLSADLWEKNNQIKDDHERSEL